MSDNVINLEPVPVELIEGIHIATIVGFAHEQVLVQVAGQAQAIAVALGCTRLSSADVGTEVALMFIEGDPARPVILDKIVRPARFSAVTVHEQELVFEADRQLTLRCGKSSVTLMRDGRVIISGKDVLSRASSVHRIRGGVIQLN